MLHNRGPYPRRFDVPGLTRATVRKVCTFVALDYCCLNFELPPASVTSIVGDCKPTREMTILGGMPHMHELGREFDQVVIRADGTEVPFIHLAGWSFEAQLIYDTPLVLRPGDTLRTTCVFDNPHEETVRSGPRTTDEMCFNFLYATPVNLQRLCNHRCSHTHTQQGDEPMATGLADEQWNHHGQEGQSRSGRQSQEKKTNTDPQVSPLSTQQQK